MTTEQAIRKLAASDYYQTLFILSKEMSGIKIFENDINFTYLQVLFIKYLAFYYSLQSDITYHGVSELVLKDDIYADAYTLYKQKNDKNKSMTTPIASKQENIPPKSRWIFKSPKKGD